MATIDVVALMAATIFSARRKSIFGLIARSKDPHTQAVEDAVKLLQAANKVKASGLLEHH